MRDDTWPMRYVLANKYTAFLAGLTYVGVETTLDIALANDVITVGSDSLQPIFGIIFLGGFVFFVVGFDTVCEFLSALLRNNQSAENHSTENESTKTVAWKPIPEIWGRMIVCFVGGATAYHLVTYLWGSPL